MQHLKQQLGVQSVAGNWLRNIYKPFVYNNDVINDVTTNIKKAITNGKGVPCWHITWLEVLWHLWRYANLPSVLQVCTEQDWIKTCSMNQTVIGFYIMHKQSIVDHPKYHCIDAEMRQCTNMMAGSCCYKNKRMQVQWVYNMVDRLTFTGCWIIPLQIDELKEISTAARELLIATTCSSCEQRSVSCSVCYC